MSKYTAKNEKLKEEVETMIANHGKNINLVLPIPDSAIILAYLDKAENPELILRRYLDIVEKAAELESKSLITGIKIKSSLMWKILLILSVVICLILGMLLGTQFQAQYDRFGITVDKKAQSVPQTPRGK